MGKSKDAKKKSKKEHKRHKKSKHHDSESEPEIDYSDPSLWVEKTDDSATATHASPPAKEQEPAAQNASRHGWMLDASFDFGSMGTARENPKDKPKPDPDQPKVSERELNVHLIKGASVEEYPEEKKQAIQFGDAGSKWRMMKLKRIMEQAEDEGRPLEELAMERYGSVEKLQEALAEKEWLDNRKRRSHGESSSSSSRRDGGRRYVFTNSDTAQRESFRRPDAHQTNDDVDEFGRQIKRRRQTTPPPASPASSKASAPSSSTTQAQRLAAAVIPENSPSTPVIFTQQEMPSAFSSSEPILSRDALNKMNANVLRAKLMGKPDADELEREYLIQQQRFEAAQQGATDGSTNQASVKVLPTVDSDGRLYDYALHNDNTAGMDRKTKNKERFKGTHDPKTGERLRYGTTDDNISLMDMVRQERAGGRGTSNMDLEFANKIMSDAAFENNLDYMDEKAEVMGAKKGMTEAQKMRFAVRDYKRTQETLDRCRYCYHDETPPQCALISLATQTYLALPNVQELVPGHCQIVPLQHVTSLLACDDDVWDEIRNFQKCLIRMFNEQGCGVVFMETVMHLRHHRHTVLEAIPVPYGVYEEASAYFKEAILASGEEWSQHKKLIETTSTRGFRNSMVKDLPYFHVWFGLDSGYGHVIENEKDFPQWFGKETLAGMMDIGPERWRRPKYHHQSENRARREAFLRDWKQWDWTTSLSS